MVDNETPKTSIFHFSFFEKFGIPLLTVYIHIKLITKQITTRIEKKYFTNCPPVIISCDPRLTYDCNRRVNAGTLPEKTLISTFHFYACF